MIKSYPLNILKLQYESSKISNLGQIFIFTENCTPLSMNHFSYPLTIAQVLKNPKISFPNQNPRPQTIEPAPPPSLLTPKSPPPGYGLIVPAVLKCLFRHNLCRRSLSTWRKIIHIYSFLLKSKIFLMYIM